MTWWLPLKAYRQYTREHCERLRAKGVVITFRGALRIYRAARDGVVYVQANSKGAAT